MPHSKQHSMYQSCVPAFIQTLESASRMLDMATEYFAEKGIPEATILDYRLYPDMFPFSRQIQVLTNHATKGMARIAGRPVPDLPNTEKSFAELKKRVEDALVYVKSFAPSEIDGTEEKLIHTQVAFKDYTFTAQHYMVRHAIPQAYFHTTTAYNILRLHGVPVGKRHYIGPPE